MRICHVDFMDRSHNHKASGGTVAVSTFSFQLSQQTSVVFAKMATKITERDSCWDKFFLYCHEGRIKREASQMFPLLSLSNSCLISQLECTSVWGILDVISLYLYDNNTISGPICVIHQREWAESQNAADRQRGVENKTQTRGSRTCPGGSEDMSRGMEPRGVSGVAVWYCRLLSAPEVRGSTRGRPILRAAKATAAPIQLAGGERHLDITEFTACRAGQHVLSCSHVL